MNEQPCDSPEMALALEDRLPLTWTPLDRLPEPHQLAKIQQVNQETLYVILSMEEHPSEWIDDHNTDPPELSHIDFKLNLLLDLVGQLLVQQIPLPDPVNVRLSPSEIRWEAKSAPEPGGLVQIDVYLNLRYPKPITLLGSVFTLESRDPGFEITVRLEGLSESLHQAIEKLVFRHHRRLIAHSRRPAARTDP